MDLSYFDIFCMLVVKLSLLFYFYHKHEYLYWKRHNIPYIEPWFPFGNVFKYFFGNRPIFLIFQEFYTVIKQKGHRFMGMYFFSRKQMLILDPNLIKCILTTDFHYFRNRGQYYNEKNDPLSANIILMNGDNLWKNTRVKLAPAFTSGKLKNMVDLATAQGIIFLKVIESEETINIKDFAARYATDVLSSCVFGIDSNSLQNPNVKLRTIGKRLLEETFLDITRRVFLRSFPKLSKFFKMRVFNKEVSKNFMKFFIENINYRMTNNLKGTDFLQVLIDLINLENDEKIAKKGFTVNEAAAQAFAIYWTGFETSAITITFALYELACNIDVQDNLRQEIREKLSLNNGEIDYDIIMQMHYLEKVIQETLRKWPTVPFIIRQCTQDYKIPESKYTIPKGMFLFIPTFALHRDPEFYEEPLVFNPDRFTDSDKVKNMKNDCKYLPFGNGPRICIGLRFAMLQIKVALVMLLGKYKFTLNEKSKKPFVFTLNPETMTVKGGVWLNKHIIK